MEIVMEYVSKLKNLICYLRENEIQLKSSLDRIHDILESVDSTFTSLSSIGMKLDLPMTAIGDFLSAGRELYVLISISLREGKAVPAEEMKRMEDSMLNFYLVDVRNIIVSEMRALQPPNLDTSIAFPHRIQLREAIPSSPGRVVVGLNHPVAELKGLIEECESPLVISAPAGDAKTDLVKMFCEDAEIIDKYGENIFFLHVPETPDAAGLVSKLCQELNLRQYDKIPSGTLEIRELENSIKNIGISNMLLVLDNVGSEWESLIDKFNFKIPGYKLLVTSRFRFPRFDGYELRKLVQNEGQALYIQSGNGHSDPNNHHVNQVHPSPSELPLLMWKRRPKENSTEGKPNLEGDVSDVSSSNYLEGHTMGDTSSTYGPHRASLG